MYIKNFKEIRKHKCEQENCNRQAVDTLKVCGDYICDKCITKFFIW